MAAGETKIQSVIDDMQAGNPDAVDRLIEYSFERLRRLTRTMLRDNPAVKRWNETDDVMQNALIRLNRALQSVTPDSVPGYFRLAATQVRRELIDLARHHYGPQGDGAHHASDPIGIDPKGRAAPLYEDADPTAGPATLLQWSEFHEHVERLPDDERDVFDLIFYQGLSQEEVGQMLGVSERTIKRRWRSAKLLLQEAMEAGPQAQ